MAVIIPNKREVVSHQSFLFVLVKKWAAKHKGLAMPSKADLAQKTAELAVLCYYKEVKSCDHIKPIRMLKF